MATLDLSMSLVDTPPRHHLLPTADFGDSRLKDEEERPRFSREESFRHGTHSTVDDRVDSSISEDMGRDDVVTMDIMNPDSGADATIQSNADLGGSMDLTSGSTCGIGQDLNSRFESSADVEIDINNVKQANDRGHSNTNDTTLMHLNTINRNPNLNANRVIGNESDIQRSKVQKLISTNQSQSKILQASTDTADRLDHQMTDLAEMIKEVQQCSDDVQQIQIQNAILMDSLVMTGADF